MLCKYYCNSLGPDRRQPCLAACPVHNGTEIRERHVYHTGFQGQRKKPGQYPSSWSSQLTGRIRLFASLVKITWLRRHQIVQARGAERRCAAHPQSPPGAPRSASYSASVPSPTVITCQNNVRRGTVLVLALGRTQSLCTRFVKARPQGKSCDDT